MKRGSAGRMIRVGMRHDHEREVRRSIRQLLIERLEMIWMSNARVEKGGAAVRSQEEISVVPGASQRTRIVGIEDDRGEQA